MSAHGLGRMSLEDVGRESGLSRQTVYRYFESKQALVTAVILREEEVLITKVQQAIAQHVDLRPAFEAGIRTMLETTRAHPLLDRLLATEPEALLPFLTTGAGPVLTAARPALEDFFTERLPHLSPPTVRHVVDMVTRLLISYTINPPEVSIEELSGSLADVVLDGLKGEQPTDQGSAP